MRGRTETYKSTRAGQLADQDRPDNRCVMLIFATQRPELYVFCKVSKFRGSRGAKSESLSWVQGGDAIRVTAWPPMSLTYSVAFPIRPCHLVTGMEMVSIPWPCFHPIRRPLSSVRLPRPVASTRPTAPSNRPPLHYTNQLLLGKVNFDSVIAGREC